MFTDPQTMAIAIQIAGFIITTLLLVNAWFARRVIEKVDGLSETVNTNIPLQEQRLAGLEKSYGEMKSEVIKVGEEFKAVSDLKTRVAVLENTNKIRDEYDLLPRAKRKRPKSQDRA